MAMIFYFHFISFISAVFQEKYDFTSEPICIFKLFAHGRADTAYPYCMVQIENESCIIKLEKYHQIHYPHEAASMKEIIAYEMSFDKMFGYPNDVSCVPFQEQYWDEYMKIYNDCFYEMRKTLEIEPINFYSDYSQVKDKINDIFLYLQNGVIVGAVSCYGNELDDLIVVKSFQGQGVGQKLLLWGMNHIKEQGYKEIILHVAEWNQNAMKLYLKNGFRIKKREKVC